MGNHQSIKFWTRLNSHENQSQTKKKIGQKTRTEWRNLHFDRHHLPFCTFIYSISSILFVIFINVVAFNQNLNEMKTFGKIHCLRKTWPDAF